MKRALAIFAVFGAVLGFVAQASAQPCAWVTGTPMPTPRSGMAVGAVDGIIYVIGGRQGPSYSYPVFLATNEAYDPANNTWSPKAPMPTPRSFDGTNGAVLGGKIYCVGGTASWTPFCTTSGCTNIVEVYDPATNTWATAAPLPYPRCAPSVVAINDLLYVIGGYTCFYSYAGGQITTSSATVDVYDPATNSWSPCGTMPVPRAQAAAAVTSTDAHIVGGVNYYYAYYQHADVLSLNSLGLPGPSFCPSWSSGAPLPTPRYAHGAVSVNGLLYVVGGRNSLQGTAIGDFNVYDPITNAWTSLPPLPSPRADAGVAVAGSHLYVIGGDGNTTSALGNAVQKFSLAAGSVSWYGIATSGYNNQIPLISTSGGAASLSNPNFRITLSNARPDTPAILLAAPCVSWAPCPVQFQIPSSSLFINALPVSFPLYFFSGDPWGYLNGVFALIMGAIPLGQAYLVGWPAQTGPTGTASHHDLFFGLPPIPPGVPIHFQWLVADPVGGPFPLSILVPLITHFGLPPGLSLGVQLLIEATLGWFLDHIVHFSATEGMTIVFCP